MLNSRPSRSACAGVTLASVLALTAAAGSVSAAAFKPGDLVVLRLGTGSAALSSAGTAEFLDEYTTTGTLVQSIALPTTASGSNNPIVDSGTATSDGALTLSQNGAYLTLGGYNAAPGTASVASAAGINRVVARVGVDGIVDTTTNLSQTTTFPAGNIRSVASTNGTTLYLAGQGSATTGGVVKTTDGATVSTPVETAVTTVRNVNLFNNDGNIYFSANSGATPGIYELVGGTGAPVSLAASPSAYDFYLTPDANTLYVADDTSSTGGLVKFTKSNGAFTKDYTVTTTSLRGLTGVTTGSGSTATTTLYGIYGTGSGGAGTSFLGSLSDATASLTKANGEAFTSIASNSANEVFRGVDFSPAPEPGEAAVLSLIGLGLGGLLLRRRMKASGEAAAVAV